MTFVDKVLCGMHGKPRLGNCFSIPLYSVVLSCYSTLRVEPGSGEGHTAYIYKRANKPPKMPTLPAQTVLKIPGRLSLQEEDCEVYCDETFHEACRLAVGEVGELREYVKGVVKQHLEGDRSKRERKPRVISDATF